MTSIKGTVLNVAERAEQTAERPLREWRTSSPQVLRERLSNKVTWSLHQSTTGKKPITFALIAVKKTSLLYRKQGSSLVAPSILPASTNRHGGGLDVLFLRRA